MKIAFAAAFAIVLLFAPSLTAKGPTLKITIEGSDLARPIEITDPTILQQFNIWSGPGTSSNESKSFIVNWSNGVVPERPKGLRRYQVSFYADHGFGLKKPAYVVLYEYDDSSGHGYVYLPGKGEQWYAQNVTSISRGVEGNWFHAWDQWDAVVKRLLPKSSSALSIQ